MATAIAQKERELRTAALKGDQEAQELLDIIETDRELRWRVKYGDPDANRKLKDFEEIQALRKKALEGDLDAIAKLKKMQEDLKKKGSKDKAAQQSLDEIARKLAEQAKNGDPEAQRKLKELEDFAKKHQMISVKSNEDFVWAQNDEDYFIELGNAYSNENKNKEERE